MERWLHRRSVILRLPMMEFIRLRVAPTTKSCRTFVNFRELSYHRTQAIIPSPLSSFTRPYPIYNGHYPENVQRAPRSAPISPPVLPCFYFPEPSLTLPFTN